MMFKVENAKRRGRRFWISTILLLAQLLTVAPILLIVSADQRQSALSQRCVFLLQELDQLSDLFRELENTTADGAKQARSVALAWQKHQSEVREEMDVISRNSAEIPGAHEILPKMDAIVDGMAQTAAAMARANPPNGEADGRIGEFLRDDDSALDQVAAAQRIVRFQLLLVAGGIAEKAGYLKILVAAACLLAFGVVFVFRGFRIDSATQRRLEQSLRSSNDEVIAALAAARDGSDAKNEALINVAEALRTPLNGMIGLTTKLLETELNREQRDCAQAGLHSALSLARVIRDIQDFAKLESARLNLVLEEFRPTQVIEDTLDAFRIAAAQKGLELEVIIAARLEILARGDAARLRQILTNLVDNAIKFTERGRIVVSATEVSRSAGRTRLRFEIKDTGIGIGEQIRERLFEPLSQADRPTAAEHAGGGLGLAISKKLVELMGGEIDVVSMPARGSTFWFTVALEHVHGSPGLQPDPAEKAPGATRHQSWEAGPHIASPTARPDSRPTREKRTESRYRINYPTLIKSKTAGVALVRVLDVSGFGLRVAAPFRLPAGSEVEIRIEATAVRGLVRNCACFRATEFHVGIELLQSDSMDERGLADFVTRRMASQSMTAKMS
jgi:signal transduction histidine kinase